MKRITSFIRLLVCLIFMAATTQHALAAIDITATQPANGTGTTDDPYQIGTPGELYWFAAQVNNGKTTLSAKLTADIVVNENVLKAGTFDLNGTPSRSWTPIGSSKNFKGTFDGNGHTISGLYFNNTSSGYYPDGGRFIGLIGYANGATIKNVVVKDSYINGYQYVAGICGFAAGSTKITNCGYEGYVYGSLDYAYGIAYNPSVVTVENCYSVSNQLLASNRTSNCYHDNIKYPSSSSTSTGKPSIAFENGEVAFLLGDAWGQKIGTDVLPIPGGDKVYKNTYSGECPGEGYSNVDEHGVVTERNHNCNAEGLCMQCGLYFISTADQLYAFAAKVNAGQTKLCAKLTADIVVNENVLKAGTFDLNGTPSRSWTPIGKSGNNFKGTFDGNGHTISGLYFNNTSSDYYPDGGQYIGLIGYANGAVIKNVVVKDSYIKGYQYVAGICGYAYGSTQITNCGYEGAVYVSKNYAYGIAYNSSATVENCYSVSNQDLARNSTTNCYHDNIKYPSSSSTGKPSSAFASGEVAFLLGEGWGQKIGTDALPIPGSDKVYKNTYSGECPGEGYSNVDEHGVVTERNHNCNAEGLCIHCGLYIISTADQLYAFAAKVNAGQTKLCAKLVADIVVNENVLKAGTFTLNSTPANEWTPIGTTSKPFQGTFDGNGHTISGLYFNNTTDSSYPNGGYYIGLIGYAEGAIIKNVVVKDSYIYGYCGVAGICGCAAGSTKITNCGYEGYVYGSLVDAYGIACNPSATVENCYSVSNQPLAKYATTNCYHDNSKYTGSTTYSTGKLSTVFASGEVAFLLGDAWGQKIGTDATPRLGGDKVYKNTYSGECPGEGYSNVDEHGVVTERNHNCNAEGLCTQCGLHLISTADQLYAFAAKVNAGQTTISAKLTADIVVNENVLKAGTFDLNGTPSRSWTPIGKSGNSFKGTFDGNGHTISGLYFNNTTDSSYPDGGQYIGLIGFANGATIKNVVVKDSYINGYQYVAGICGYESGSSQITNCGYEGYVSGNYSYGIVYNGYKGSAIKNCYSVSNLPLAYYATTNCYHDNSKCTSSTTYSTGKPSIAFENGEVAFLLGDAWGQKIGTDATPRLGGDKVYKNTYSGECPGEGYSNVDEHGVVTNRNHNFDEDGVCTQCGVWHLISTADQLYAFAAKVNAGQTNLCAKLTADIVVNENVLNSGTFDLNGTPSRSWTPIGSGNDFKGTFDGNGHTISGLYFNNTSSGYYPDGGRFIGLIGAANGATIKNVVVKDSYIKGYQYVAGICGYANGSTQITNCGYEGAVYVSNNYAYGIAYNYSATVENCYSVSNKPLAYKATTNCYHDNSKCTSSTTYSTGKPSSAFASGEVAWLLGDAWGQKIGTDVLPIPGGDKVYKNTYSGECPGEGYSNVDEHGVVTERNHNCNAEGLCMQCGLYFISTADQLYAFAAKVNAGQTKLCAKLVADIVVNENVMQPGTFTLNGTPSRSWTPIGKSGNTFKGIFDGNGHTISGLYFNNTTDSSYPNGGDYIGLIGYAEGATIKNVVVKDSYIKGYQYVAGICGFAAGSTQITNCGYEGYVSGNYSCGIAYKYKATVENCYSVSNRPLADDATTNCYHDNNKYTGSTANSTGKPSEAFASGEVAFLLGDAWGQKIGTDATPRPGGDKVYKNTYSGECSGEGYSNVDEHGVVTNRNHNFDEDGVCTQCGLHLISTADQLYAFAAKVNAGQTTLCAKLTADIVVNKNVLNPGTFDLNGTPANVWTPIGTNKNNFQGTFDGNGHTISGLYFNNTVDNYNIAFIGRANGATIKNVVVKDSYLRGRYTIAGICVQAYGSTTISNCGYEGYLYAASTSNSQAYGIVYDNSYTVTVTNCYSVSNAPLSNTATTNCYHDNTKYQENTYYSVGKSSESFANGEVAYLLGDDWGQKIGTDATPRLGGDKLYAKQLCPHTNSYSNTPSEYIPITDTPEHYDSNGYCKVCGAYQPAKQVDGIYEIDNVGKLYWLAEQVKKGETTINAKLTADIMVNEKYSYSREWIPIGSSVNPFKGTFDGNGYVISGLYFNNTSISSGQYIGLIGYANGATIKNVVVNSSYIRGYQYVGGICGYAAGSTIISNCGYVGNVYGSYSYYGLAYISTATVENCYCVSNQPMASSATTNCYHDNTKYTGLTYCSIGKSSEAFERGEIAWLLNGGSSDGVWGQNIGTESIPFIGGKKVYVTALCPHSFAGSNVEGSFTPIEDGDEHYDSDGYCKVCGVGLAPELVGNYYEIAKVAHLYWFAEQVNSGNTSIRAKLIADIVVNKNVLKPGSLTLNGTPARKWVPIGMNFNTRYTGEFDGNGHTISGLYYDDTSYKDDNAHVGLIGYAERVWITNLIVKDSYLRGRKYVGGICGYADRCVMSRCGFEGYLYKSGSDGYNSGIAYDYNCRLENCFSRSNAPMGYNPYDSQLIFGCYHDKTLFAGTSTLSTGKTSEEFASGEVAYSIRIGQNIGIDESPNFGGAEVFKLSATVASGAHGTFSCASYANAGATAFTAEPEIGYELVLQIGGGTIAYTGNTFNMPAQNTTLSVDFVKANYAIAKEANYVGGKVTVKATAQYQDEVSISVVPDPGYVIETYELTDASGNAIAVTNGKFTMPASAVNVNVVFSPTGYVENGKVYGDWVVTSDYTIAAGETLVIPAGTTVTTYGGAVIINNGTLKVEDEISGVTLAGDGVFNYTTLSKYDVTFGTAVYNGSPITIGNGLDVTYATKTFCGKTFTFDAESCTITYLNNVNASVGTRYAVVTWDFSGNTATKEFAILKRKLNLTGFIANNKNYDGTTQATGSFSDDRIAGDELEFNYKCAFEDENVGTGKNVSFYRIEIDGGADADNYELVTTEGSASANINKAPLTIKANDFTINVGDEMPTFTVEYDGFVAAQNVEVLSTLPTVGVDITETSVDGTYDINVSGAEADNYEISYTKGTLTIKPATATAIDEVASADVKIYSRGNIIVVENADSPIEVFDISGTRVERQSEILSRVEIPMAGRGVFVVRTGNISQKVIVK